MSDEMFEVPSADWFVPFLLLSLRERDSDGHELTWMMAGLGFGASRPEAIYLTLWQMEKEGRIFSESDGLDGPLHPQGFSITESGEAYLESWASSLEQYREEIDLFLGIYGEGSGWGTKGNRAITS